MPILDGYDATDQIREVCRKYDILQPMVIACTGHVEDEYIKKAWRHQIDEVVSKPINIDIVKEILKEIIIT